MCPLLEKKKLRKRKSNAIIRIWCRVMVFERKSGHTDLFSHLGNLLSDRVGGESGASHHGCG